MIPDKAHAASCPPSMRSVATPGMGRVEHRSFLQMTFTHILGDRSGRGNRTKCIVKKWRIQYTAARREDVGNTMRLRNPHDFLIHEEDIFLNSIKEQMGPGAGVEPASGEVCRQEWRPQSPMLPLHHPGHGLVGSISSHNRLNLLAYPYSYSMKPTNHNSEVII